MNLNAEEALRIFFDKYYKNMHPETALRYLPIVKEIKRLKLVDSKILEIGSGSLGITPYLKSKIDGVDIDFTGPQTPLVNKVNGSAYELPFRKNSYDTVISVDVLEHIPQNLREKSVYEMIKVTKRLAVIVIPVGEKSELQDQKLYGYWKNTFREKNDFLSEHVKNGLPKSEEILVYINRSLRNLDKKAKVKSYPLLNLKVREMLMKTWISKNKYFYYLYMKGYLLLLPLLKMANFGSCYRRLYIIEME